MTNLSAIKMTQYLRTQGWEFREAYSLARMVKVAQAEGLLPPGGLTFAPEGPGRAVTVRQLEEAGGVTRVTLVPLRGIAL